MPAAGDDDVVVLTPATRTRRRQTRRTIALFVALGLPVAAILAWLVTPLVALAYLIGQTAFLTFALQRRHQPVLRLSVDGVAFEAGHFVLRSSWANVERVGAADLPSGQVESLILGAPSLHWAADAATRATVAKRGWDRIVPVAEFEDDWRHGRAGRAVRRWAPHLL